MPSGWASGLGKVSRTTLNFEGVNAVSREGLKVVDGVRPWADAKHGVDKRPGVLHVAVVSKHLLFEVCPCLPEIVFVEGCPVFGCPLGIPKQGSGRGCCRWICLTR